MKKIVIAGASTFGVNNFGDDAMFSNLVDGLRRRIPDCKLTFLARHPNKEFDNYFGVRSIKNIDHESKKQSLGRRFFGFNPDDPTNHLREIRQEIADCDLMVLAGNSFMEVSGNDFLRGVASYAALLATLAKLFEKPFCLYGVACHPLQDDYTKQIARFLCENAKIVTVREDFTKQQLLSAGVNGSNIHVLADPAFGIEPSRNRAEALAILKDENIQLNNQKVIGVCFRHLYWKWKDDECAKFTTKMARLCDLMIEGLSAELLFIPNCTYQVDTPYEDDKVISELIRKKMKYAKKTHLIKGDYNLEQVLSLFQLLEMMVSNRRHSCIFASLYNLPIIALSIETDWHLRPFMEALSLSEQVVNFRDTNIDFLQIKIKETWLNKDSIARKLSGVLPNLRKKAQQHTDLLAQLLV